MDIALKASLFLGTVLLIGAGFTARWISPELRAAPGRYLTGGLVLGAVLIFAGSLGDVLVTVTRILRGRSDATVFFDYLLSTRHGQVVLVRMGLTLLLAFWGTRSSFTERLDKALYALAGLSLLATLSLVSHSGVLGPLPLLGDLLHLIGATSWAGALLYFAFLPSWSRREVLLRAVRRVSVVGLSSVCLIFLTGVYLATLHLFSLRALSTTTYGLALVVKVALVLTALAIAGINRWLLVPRLERRAESRPLRLAVRLESLLLVAVLGATSVLTTREPAHHPEEHHDHAAARGQPPVRLLAHPANPADVSLKAVSPAGDGLVLEVSGE